MAYLRSDHINSGIKQWDTYRITSEAALGSAVVVTANWERDDTGMASNVVGTGVTESSGIFTFPSTGIWLLMGFAYAVGDCDPYAGWGIEYTSTGSSGTWAFIGESYCHNDGSNEHSSSNASAILRVADTANTLARIKSNASGSAGTWSWHGSSTGNKAGIHFIRLGDLR